MRHRATLIFVPGAVLLMASAAGAQSLAIKGPAGQSKTLSAADLAALPHVEVKMSEHGAVAAYGGAAVSDLLALVGAPRGEALRGLRWRTC